MTEEVSWVKWHFSKWLGDPALRMCSLPARGLWADLLAIMHECEPYGYLLLAERSPSHREIARLVGTSHVKQVHESLGELISNKVCGVTDDGVIFSRRMVRDKKTRDKGRENGSLGGNPKLKRNATETPETQQRVNPESETEREKESEKDSSLRSPRAREVDVDGEFDQTFWPAYARKDDKGHAIKAFRAARRKVSLEVIMDGLAAYHFNEERRLQPLPATWLNGERWADQRLDLSGGCGIRAGPPKISDDWGINSWISKQSDAMDGIVGGRHCKTINGWSIVHYAECLADAAGLPRQSRVNWDCLGQLLRDDLGMIDEKPVLDAVRSQASRMTGSIGSIKVFDSTIRGVASRSRRER